VAAARDSLPQLKLCRDAIRMANGNLKDHNGLMGQKSLLRDFEERKVGGGMCMCLGMGMGEGGKRSHEMPPSCSSCLPSPTLRSHAAYSLRMQDHGDSLKSGINQLREQHANLTGEMLSIKRKMQRQLGTDEV
jgi:hypothetical protein